MTRRGKLNPPASPVLPAPFLPPNVRGRVGYEPSSIRTLNLTPPFTQALVKPMLLRPSPRYSWCAKKDLNLQHRLSFPSYYSATLPWYSSFCIFHQLDGDFTCFVHLRVVLIVLDWAVCSFDQQPFTFRASCY
jgi:hypothetical protein